MSSREGWSLKLSMLQYTWGCVGGHLVFPSFVQLGLLTLWIEWNLVLPGLWERDRQFFLTSTRLACHDLWTVTLALAVGPLKPLEFWCNGSGISAWLWQTSSSGDDRFSLAGNPFHAGSSACSGSSLASSVCSWIPQATPQFLPQ